MFSKTKIWVGQALIYVPMSSANLSELLMYVRLGATGR